MSTAVWVAAVTGNVDSGNDVFQPGCFNRTLKTRTPKALKEHDFNKAIGRVVAVEEYLPGDPRLPKTQPNGQVWPKQSGALVASVEYNLNTVQGKEAYEEAKFYGAGETRCSVGYKVTPNGSHNENGVRVITDVDLFEVTQTCWGMNDAASVVDIKAEDGMEFKTLGHINLANHQSTNHPPFMDEVKSLIAEEVKSQLAPFGLVAKTLDFAAAAMGNDIDAAVMVAEDIAQTLGAKSELSDDEQALADAIAEVLESFDKDETVEDEIEVETVEDAETEPTVDDGLEEKHNPYHASDGKFSSGGIAAAGAPGAGDGQGWRAGSAKVTAEEANQRLQEQRDQDNANALANGEITEQQLAERNETYRKQAAADLRAKEAVEAYEQAKKDGADPAIIQGLKEEYNRLFSEAANTKTLLIPLTELRKLGIEI